MSRGGIGLTNTKTKVSAASNTTSTAKEKLGLSNVSRRWTAEEDKKLLDCIQNDHSIKAIAGQFPGRTYRAVESRARRLRRAKSDKESKIQYKGSIDDIVSSTFQAPQCSPPSLPAPLKPFAPTTAEAKSTLEDSFTYTVVFDSKPLGIC